MMFNVFQRRMVAGAAARLSSCRLLPLGKLEYSLYPRISALPESSSRMAMQPLAGVRHFARQTRRGGTPPKSRSPGATRERSAEGSKSPIFDAQKSKYSIENELRNQKQMQQAKEARKKEKSRTVGAQDRGEELEVSVGVPQYLVDPRKH